MLIDTHCHVNFSAYDEDRDDVIRRTLANDIFMINVGTQKDTSAKAVAIAEQYERGVYAAIGLHPIHVMDRPVDEEETKFHARAEEIDPYLYRRLAKSPKVVAIGEAGLDYFHIAEGEDPEAVKERQKKEFLTQVDLADELDLPLIIHCRDAHEDLLPLVKKLVGEGKMKRRGTFHFFSSSWDILLDAQDEYQKMGFYFGFTGAITLPPKKSSPREQEILLEAVKRVSDDRILTETDAPYITPVPHRGKRNEPLYVELVAQRIAELRGWSLEETKEKTFSNAMTLFQRIKK